MKKLIYIIFASVMILTGCSDDFELNDNDQDLIVQLLDGDYVAYSADGANTTIDAIETNEAGGDIVLNVEIPTGSESDVTVNFTFGGTAVYGTDFTVPGGSSAGGSVVIVPDDGGGTDNIIDNADITVTLLRDDVVDGTKTLDVILSSASNAEGDVNVGRGGTDILKTASITILDFCELNATNIVGDWVLDMQDSFGDGWNNASVTVEIDGAGTDYVLDDFSTDGGSTGTATITVPAGSTTLAFFFNSGDFDEEVTFQITAPTGNQIGDFGVNPPTGLLSVDACAI